MTASPAIPARRSPPHLRQLPAAVNAVRVLLCEDQEIYRVGLRTLIENERDLSVVGETPDVADAVPLSGRVGAEVIVVAQGLLRAEADEALHALCASGAAVLVLAESDSELELVRALRGGARGYLLRALAAPRLIEGIRMLSRDEPALDPAIARHLMRFMSDGTHPAQKGPPLTPLNQLTERQRAVALLVGEGLTNEQIAARLFISLATVKSHLTAVLRRLDIRTRTQLAILVNRDEVLLA